MDKRILFGVIAVIVIVGSVSFYFATITPTTKQNTPLDGSKQSIEVKPTTQESKKDIIKFASYNEVTEFLKDSQNQANQIYPQHGGVMLNSGGFRVPEAMPRPMMPPMMESPTASVPGAPDLNPIPFVDYDSSSHSDFSTTNVQVKNVDEPDYLKTDGDYIYIVNQNSLSIIKAIPADDAKLVLKIALDIEPQNLENMFLNGDRLVIFYYGNGQQQGIAQYDFAPYPIYSPKTFATIIDVSDKQNPKTVTKYEVDGNYVHSRMIEDTVYLVTLNGIDYTNPVIPRIMAGSEVIMPDVFRFPNPSPSYNFNTVTAFDVSGEMKNSETFLMGNSDTIYVSEDNLYITYQKYLPFDYYDTTQKDRFFLVIVPLLPKSVQDQIKSIEQNLTTDAYSKWNQISQVLQDTYNKLPKDQKEKLFEQIQQALDEYDSKTRSDTQRTVIHKIALDEGNLRYVANNEVGGYILNQFSMDEHDGKFRIATTSDSFSRIGSTTSSNVYVLDENLTSIGSLSNIAPDERIFSARFMADKLYLVTFKQIDPFFVIDLSSNQPKILGALKIPGFSNYLQPYDQNHIIGFGRDTKEMQGGGVRTNGIKVSMFDVTDFANPKEIDTILIGDSSTNSEALYNHKSLLLDKEKNVMSIPVQSNYGILLTKGESIPKGYDSKYWNGFYVYGFENYKFVQKGTVTHYVWDNNYAQEYIPSRSLYIGDNLYTVMDGKMKISSLSDLKEINSINLGKTGNLIKYLDNKTP